MLNALVSEGLRVAPFLALVSLRVAVVLAMLPAPFGDLSPVVIRGALSFVLAFVITLPALHAAPVVAIEPVVLFGYALSELLVGAAIGITARVTLAAAEAAGTLAGNAMGLGFANQIDPLFNSEGVPTTSLLSYLAVLIFFVLRGHHTVIEALSASLLAAPAAKGFATFHTDVLLNVGTRIVAQGLRIAAPVVGTMFISQLGMALVSRAAPRVQIFALTFGVAVSVGSLILVASAPQIAQGMANNLSTIPDTLAQLLAGGSR
ncbi:MAG TPA: flagellar biosynthetic protein FliR [Polyangiales bacterium]